MKRNNIKLLYIFIHKRAKLRPLTKLKTSIVYVCFMFFCFFGCSAANKFALCDVVGKTMFCAILYRIKWFFVDFGHPSIDAHAVPQFSYERVNFDFKNGSHFLLFLKPKSLFIISKTEVTFYYL